MIKQFSLVLILILTLFASLFSGCGSKEASKADSEINTTSASETAQSDNKTTFANTTASTETTTSSGANNQTESTTISETTGSAEETHFSETVVEETDPPQPTPEPTTERYVVRNISEDETSSPEPYKYGVTRITITTKYYNEFSDGTKEFLDSSSRYKYNTPGYSATNDDLKAESNSTAAANRTYYEQILVLVNQIRAEVGASPLTLDDTLCKSATMRAVEMAYSNKVSHTRPDGSSCFTVLSYYNIAYRACGENIAAGYLSPESVVEGWKNSPGHYANMIKSDFTKLGVGYFNIDNGYRYYWAQLFTN